MFGMEAANDVRVKRILRVQFRGEKIVEEKEKYKIINKLKVKEKRGR
jgi:hypothetical protein